MTLTEELQWRGFVNQTTLEDIRSLNGEPITFYWGVDPSSDSMQVGNLGIAMMIKHFIAHGHQPVLLVGGATGMIGDPDGKDSERQLLSLEQVEHNKQKIAEQYRRVFDGLDIRIVDNYDWFKQINFLNFLRDIGKHVPMSQMLGREFVQARLGEQGSGISYAEFSYVLIQAYDFLHLFRDLGVTMQVCGSDQWGNSIAGVELIRRIEGAEAHVWSAPLIMNKTTGRKFGKSEEGAVWLDDTKTSVYAFYQFWLNTGDADVIDYLKVFTMIDRDGVEQLNQKTEDEPSLRVAQRTLAYEVTKIVHGQERADAVRRISDVLFSGGSYSTLEAEDMTMLSAELPCEGVQISDGVVAFLVATSLAASNTEARRLLNAGAISINGKQLDESHQEFTPDDFMHGYAIVKKGKNNFALARH